MARNPAPRKVGATFAAIMLRDLVELCHGEALKAGWFHNPRTGKPLQRNFGEMIALIHSEVSESLEGIRKHKMDDHVPRLRNVTVELADAVIRIFDLAGYLNDLASEKSKRLPGSQFEYDLGAAFVAKLNYNRQRPDHKIEARRKKGGKAF